MRYDKFEITDKAIGVCSIDYTPIHRDLCIAYGADLFCKKCLQEILKIALDNGLVEVPRDNNTVEVSQESDNDVEEFKCEVCGRTFNSWRAFLAHKRSHRKDEYSSNG